MFTLVPSDGVSTCLYMLCASTCFAALFFFRLWFFHHCILSYSIYEFWMSYLLLIAIMIYCIRICWYRRVHYCCVQHFVKQCPFFLSTLFVNSLIFFCHYTCTLGSCHDNNLSHLNFIAVLCRWVIKGFKYSPFILFGTYYATDIQLFWQQSLLHCE